MEKETRELTTEELDGVSGGTPAAPKKTAPPKSEPVAIEVQDYGFGVSMPVS
jgi:hypothetical protein